ncbi:Acyl-CoA dehydrogenase [Malonomonas rubra DSM 5091]|uniref:Acyl-CoA dehydrogenase n=1 Tax=Malonomonas rubra DSM 5091 TaxID=1122189 RepID=A0A1M6LMG7_MALRU|nr:acyl-CoA dehydrogenase family protein [Malonomonas rubra]SHJ72408.1 Acyl-CoA dehydrogenase [Malonomonas rubra DSM 5091]
MKSSDKTPIRPEQSDSSTPFPVYLETFQKTLHNLFHTREDIDQLSTRRGLPPYVLRDIMACSPFATFIPDQYGGRGGQLHEGIALVEAASYESLPLALMFGINWALFIQPVTKYAQEQARESVLTDFVQQRKMGGLMITEPEYGSDALHMQSSWTEHDGLCRLQGTKHWAGLTGWADYWLLTARHFSEKKGLGRDIDFFICDANAPGQQIIVEEKYNNLGIYMLPYGRNRIDVVIPKTHQLVPQSTGVKMMLDLLHRSRMQFPAMAIGFVRRILDEATTHCRGRQVGGKSLASYDQVQARLARIQSAVTICSALCLNTSEKAGLENNLATHGVEANAVKTCVTDLMQESSQSLLQLVGAKGYRLDHFAGRATIDNRPFQIFEGSNDILYIQIGEALLKQMKVAKEQNLQRYLCGYALTDRAAERLKNLLSFAIDSSLPQRKLLEIGQVISRIIVMNLVLKLADKGFNKSLIDNCLATLQQEISALLTGYASANLSTLLAVEEESQSWRDCLAEPKLKSV